jgi:hypothetical protein
MFKRILTMFFVFLCSTSRIKLDPSSPNGSKCETSVPLGAVDASREKKHRRFHSQEREDDSEIKRKRSHSEDKQRRAGVGVKRKQERGVEIMTKTGTKGAEVEIEIGETGAEAERGTEVGKQEREETGVTAGKREEGQEIGVLVPLMTKENMIQEVKSKIRFQMELESSWQLLNLRLGR